MSSNAKILVKDTVDQRKKESFPEMSIQDYFGIFSADQITKDYSLSFEEIESGIVDGEHDGGIDAVYVFVNGELIREDTNVTGYNKEH